MSEQGLVPEDLQDFRSKEFWAGFFKSRGDRAFEWYGEWRQLKPLTAPLCSRRRILMLGCGNSDLSADMYDDGLEDITNIDFVASVVRDMLRKNVRARPRMRWQVMDMTSMTFTDGEFDVAFDKGGLDALMGDESSDADSAGVQLLAEVARVLHPQHGTYICVTLAQSHVLRALLNSMEEGWRTVLHKVPPPPDMAQSPLQPLVAVVTHDSSAAPSGARAHPVEVNFQASTTGPDAEQLADVLQVVGEVNARRASGIAAPLPRAARAPKSAAIAALDEFADLHPGRRWEMATGPAGGDFSQQEASNGQQEAVNGQQEAGGRKQPRFRAAVLDLDQQAAASAVRDCGVFIVPQGRENEWIFASAEGQRQLAGNCMSRRLVVVSLGRGHTFPAVAALQAELSPLVLPLAPVTARATPKAIPFMTAGEGVGRRSVVAEAMSAISGPIIVEDVTIREESRDKVLRRMVFTANRNLIQSEAVLSAAELAAAREPTGNAPVMGNKKEGKNRGGNKKKQQQQQPAAQCSSQLAVDHSQLPCEYHQAIVAGLALRGASSNAVDHAELQTRGRALVVGLGGGGLPVFLDRHCGLEVHVAELDPTVLQLARDHFALPQTPNLQVQIQDGLEAIAAAQPGQWDVIVVDAGSGDASLPMSCPPPAFLEAQQLQSTRAALAPNGLFAVNCVTRSEAAFQSAVAALKAVYPQVHAVEVLEDVNRVLLARVPAEGNLPHGKQNGHDTSSTAAMASHIRQRLLHSTSKTVTDDIVDMLDGLKLC